MEWNVQITRNADKQVKKLEEDVVFILRLLVKDLQQFGPIPGKGWRNYGKLTTKKNEDKRHCHLSKW